MKPLSKKRRLGYVIFLIVLFVVFTPLLILYASGYRLDKAFRLETTGGLYISTTHSGAEIYLESDLVKRTSIFQKNAFIQNLKPSSYSILVKKEGYQEWRKTLAVFAETVTEAYPFMFPTTILTTEIPQKISPRITGNATTSVASGTYTDNPDYTVVVKLFSDSKISSATPSLKVSTSTEAVKEFRKLSVENTQGTLRIRWKGEPDNKPAYFCQNEICKKEIFIKPKSKLKSFDFFPGRDDLIIMSLEDGIYVSEIDDRSEQNVQKLFDGRNTDFRIKDGDKIFFKKDKIFYSVAI